MGFFDSKVVSKDVCAICEKELGFKRYKIADKNWICSDCLKKAGGLFKINKAIDKLTVEEIHNLIHGKEEKDMVFFDSKEVCAICEKELGLMHYKIHNNKLICSACLKKAGGLFKIDNVEKLTVEEIHGLIHEKEEKENERMSFTPTKKIGAYVEFDDNQKKWLVLSAFLGSRKKSTVYNYSDIVDFELLEDGESVSQGGLGRALVGGALFGGTGAIVGGVTANRKNKAVCNSLKIKVTVKDINNPVVYINFINVSTQKNGHLYKSSFRRAHECLSIFQLICDDQKETPTQNFATLSNADEIRNYKQLLDEGIITSEEFEKKKKELLGI